MTRDDQGWWVEYEQHGVTLESMIFDTEHDAQTFVSELPDDVAEAHVIPPHDD